ncbi:TPA: TIGR03752 family integrating conjugative element protein [Escherichia coli]|nr:TIGR03752 family integrating conjugative element protein [Escherichia coli]MBF5241270.1 TIGR03752 family integrating conjugative element protein [Escherichia coli]HBB2482702.1 TIGR03752 family integrating conjugative element protein [Escherichia coli]
MQIKSNAPVKFVVPAVVLVGLAVTMKSCKTQENVADRGEQARALSGLSSEELRALGVEGDTPEDTLRTLVARMNQVRDNQRTLEKQNSQLLKDNEQLRRRSTDVSGQVNDAVAGGLKTYEQKQRELQEQQHSLMSQIDAMKDQLSRAETLSRRQESDIPPGLGLDAGGGSGVVISQGADGLMWVSPADQSQDDPLSSSGSKGGPRFPTSFLEDNALSRQKAEYEQQVKGYSNEQQRATTQAVYTLPENSTLTGSRAMTALLGRVPINGTVTDPYPFKILVGRDNLTANGIELPDVEGAIVSGTASGDWTLSCVRGQVNSITFVFADGTVRTLPSPDVNGTTNSNQQAKGNGTGGIGWISDEDGIPCISGTRKSNASSYLPTIFALSAAGAAGDALSEGQYTSQNNVNGITSTLTGSAGQAVLGKALSGGMNETADWVRQRYGQTFDAIYVPPGKALAVHITRQLAIDYEDQGRRVRYDFALPGEANDHGGLD